MQDAAETFSEQSFLTDEDRWSAVTRRDKKADGHFFYSVKTTGVYCRPQCAARLALRENVQFFESITAAESAGFRPCKRCKPAGISQEQSRMQLVESACRTIEASERVPDLESLSKAAGLSRFHFLRIFKTVLGVSPREYHSSLREQRLREELGSAASVTEAMYNAGFQSSSQFYSNATDLLGMTPKSFRSGGRGMQIRYGIGQSVMGTLLVAVTERGVCSLQMGEHEPELLAELTANFPQASLQRDDAGVQPWIEKAIEAVEQPETAATLPLDIHGTAFQKRVWQSICSIKPGTTTSYAELARQLGSPRAVRAVAGACAANKIAVAIPCHRVLHSNGALSGYRWGVDRKRKLLDRERVS
jgi:AraC family transcriptional regulator, regulatory protein of adaptative response / methylated-DNA-[protein]-cysteine methyltransferase